MKSSASMDLIRRIRSIWLFGLMVVLFAFGVFAAWAGVAPLSSAAIAPGKVSPDSSRKTIQHLEGGIISRIEVREGDMVKQGQVLLTLERTQAEANFSARREQWMRLRVMRARLLAQVAQEDHVELADDILDYRNPEFQQFVRTQRESLELQRSLTQEKRDIYEKQIHQVRQEIDSIKAQSKGFTEQIGFLETEIRDKKTLLEKGLMRKPDIYPLERKVAELKSARAANDAKITQAQQKIEEIHLSQASLVTEALDGVADELTKVNAELAQTQEDLGATKDILKRTEIVSPVDGTVMNLRFKTVGGVVRPGEPILDVVPSQDDLIIDAKLAPMDIDNIAMGMETRVQLSSLPTRHMPFLGGEVVQIGADAEQDPDTHEEYYSIKVRVDMAHASEEYRHVKLHPGMPATAFIITGEHTPFEYFADPIARSFRKAFREETEAIDFDRTF